MIEFKQVSKHFTRSKPPALSEVSFSVREGEIFGLLGHNGAGKSTAMGVMLGLVHPDSGEASIGGVSVQKSREEALETVGAIFESPRFYDYISGRRNLRILTSYSCFWDTKLVEETINWVGLRERIDDKVRTYSHGMRQRLALAQALLPRPKVLLLDEPTNGLDPNGIVELRERIRKLRDDFGITVLLNSHLLNEVELLCDRIAILRNGEKIFEGEVTDFAKDGVLYHFELDDWVLAKRSLQPLSLTFPREQQILVPKTVDPAKVIKLLTENGVAVREMRKISASLENFYLELSRSSS